jgi:hypothetical protein
MKLINPNFLGFSVDYRIRGLETTCKDFNDPYCELTYERTGCFGCEHLDASSGYNVFCEKNHAIDVEPVAIGDGKILEFCPAYTSRWNKYSNNGCRKCDNVYTASREYKCRAKITCSKEIYRTD